MAMTNSKFLLSAICYIAGTIALPAHPRGVPPRLENLDLRNQARTETLSAKSSFSQFFLGANPIGMLVTGDPPVPALFRNEIRAQLDLLVSWS